MTLVRRFASRAAARDGLLAHVRNRTVIDFAQLGCALLLFAAPFWFAFPPAAAWNLWIAGYVMLTFSVAALVAEAEWEPQANLILGLWLLAAPWMLALSQDTAATLLHLAGGIAICVLAAFELWHAEENPPRRFGPAAARRPDLISVVRATAALYPPTARGRRISRPSRRAKYSPRPHAEARAIAPRRHASRSRRVACAPRLGAVRTSGLPFETPAVAARCRALRMRRS